MPTLLDPITDDQRHLFRVIAEGWQAAGEQWPVWQYVQLRLNAYGKNAEEIFNSLPTWLHSYRPVFSSSGNLSPPSAEDQVGLTVQGMVAVDNPGTNLLLLAFVRILVVAEQRQRAAVPDPRSVVEIRRSLAELLSVGPHATRPPDVDLMAEMLKHEPATWGGLASGGEGWHWDLSRTRLSPYRGIETAVDYLERLEALVGIPQPVAGTEVIGPMSLVEELDHFALAWRLLTKERILRLPRASLIGQLTQPVASRAEFSERCTALADVVGNFDLPLGNLPKERSASLHRLDAQLAEREVDDATDAVTQLRRIIRVRNGQQHSFAAASSDKDWAALGLARFGADWAGAWERIQVVAIQALRTIREGVMRTVDGPTE